MRSFDLILNGHETESEQDAIDFARGIAWCEVESSEQNIPYKRYITTVDGIGVYYDYGADYYFFTDET